ncbi:LysM peptidoglycan-binding domain-containing protein [Ligilactobacillus sp. WILCCON 0076]|uniref:LysM peptidoglycan-binding domain-containing protein n=1 Tax=Ligilactobacillus ubinensis TaxID=2876789 RepID=A0A9X2FL68_9LACO|nr:C40 family peptidase [Ligilactobacillus ubinensis]MCP0887582.1 LysM peptidoglycan-binding domain-containing protein [Ligilactobacillus ubinensis]
MNNTTKKLLVGTVGAAGLFLASSTTANADTTYKVVKSDSVWALSQKYGVSIKSIETSNNVNQSTHLITVGQTLTIPTTSSDTTSSSTTSSDTTQVTVASGDSLWKLAQEYNTTVAALRELNGLSEDTTLIHVGDVLKVSGTSTTSTASTASETTSTASTATSTASETTSTAASTAATSSSVASSSATTTDSSSSSAYVSSNHVTYTVESGDSLYTIAQEYGVTVASLRAANSLGSSLQVGQTLTINDPTKTPSTTTDTTSAATTSSSSTTTATAADTATTSTAATSSSSSVASSSKASSSSTTATTTSSSTTSSTSTSSVSGSSIVSYAETLTGIPYLYGGTTTSGFDCSGFTQYVYAHFGISLPRTAASQSLVGTSMSVSSAKAGDLLFWGSKGSSYHVGIYIGGTSYIAAPTSGESVSVKSYQYYQPTFAVHVSGVNN